MMTYLVPAGYGEAEFTEKRSRFIGRVWRTDTEAEALERLRETREANRDATHNVYAYTIRDNNITRYSDDGEPGGTSGLPTLNVFSSEKIENFCCVVTRYFGGTLLGTGGLVHAYSKAAKMALEKAGVAQMAQWCAFTLSCDYGFYERSKRILEDFKAVIQSTEFGVEIEIEALVRKDKAEEFEVQITDASSGKTICKAERDEFLGVRVR